MKIKKSGLLSGLALGLLLFGMTSQSHAEKVGLGLILGDPSGLSGKVWMNDTEAWDFAVGTFGYYLGERYGGVNLHADYLWHHYDVFGSSLTDVGRKMPLYVGVGGVYSTPGAAGVRGVIGITYIFDHPFDLFLEFAPTLVVVPSTGFGIDSGLGGRFYF